MKNNGIFHYRKMKFTGITGTQDFKNQSDLVEIEDDPVDKYRKPN